MKRRCHRIRATIEIDTIEWTVEHDDPAAAKRQSLPVAHPPTDADELAGDIYSMLESQGYGDCLGDKPDLRVTVTTFESVEEPSGARAMRGFGRDDERAKK